MDMGRFSMLSVTKKRLKKERKRKGMLVLACMTVIFLFAGVCFLTQRSRSQTFRISYQACALILRQIAPNLSENSLAAEPEDSEYTYATQAESSLVYEKILAQNAVQENAEAAGQQEEETQAANAEAGQSREQAETALAGAGGGIALEKLNDFDYLIQNFYTVDSTTTIDSSRLNAGTLLTKNCSIQKRQDAEPQILIYHTHASEGYSDSTAGDLSTTVVGVGEHLAQILRDTYGYQVLHDTGVYDTERDQAYSVAAPYIQQILSDHPTIEVVIDLHRDGVADTTRLVTEQNGVQMAQVMFFNGLSRTTAMGDISYLPNPYIEDNLAFSLQLQVAARQMYPDFTRKIYLKGYRYNLHFRPKSVLVEVGAQTNTLQEAMNAMDPLAKILDTVLDDTG